MIIHGEERASGQEGNSIPFGQWIRGDAMKESVDIYCHIDAEDVRKSYMAYVFQLEIQNCGPSQFSVCNAMIIILTLNMRFLTFYLPINLEK